MNRQLFNSIIAQYEKHTVRSNSRSNGWRSELRWSGGIHCYLSSVKIYGNSQPSFLVQTYYDPCDLVVRKERISFSDSPPYNYAFRTPVLRGLPTAYAWDETYLDEWDYVTGKGLRRVKELILDGEINKVSSLEVDGSARVEISEPCIEETGAIISTHFPSVSWREGLTEEEVEEYEEKYGPIPPCICLAPDRHGIIMDFIDYSWDIDDWNEWLKERYDAGEPVTVHYVLEKPIPFEERPEPYQPIPNDSGYLRTTSGNYDYNAPFEVTYVTYSRELSRLSNLNLLNLAEREVVNFGANANTSKRSFTGKGIIKGFAYNNYYNPSNVTSFEKWKNGFSLTNAENQTSYGIGFDIKLVPNATYACSYDGLENYNGSAIFLTEFDGDGNFLRYVKPKSPDKSIRTFTTSANAVWGVFSFRNPLTELTKVYNNVSITLMG